MRTSTPAWFLAAVVLCLISWQHIFAQGQVTSRFAAWDSETSPCPVPCVGPASDWTVYTNFDMFATCHRPILLDFSVHNPVDDPSTSLKLRACTSAGPGARLNNLVDPEPTQRLEDRISRSSMSSYLDAEESTAFAQSFAFGQVDHSTSSDLAAATKHIQSYLKEDRSCEVTILLGYFRGAMVGVYAGAMIEKQSLSSGFVQHVIHNLETKGASLNQTIQVCGSGISADYAFGITTSGTGDVATIQNMLRSWSGGACPQFDGIASKTIHANLSTRPTLPNPRGLDVRTPHAQAVCSWVRVVPGSSCGSLAATCKILGNEFDKLNPGICSTLTPGQPVCCSEGSLPDLRPRPHADGRCHPYLVKANDNCANIAATYQIELDDIRRFNKETWGWMGCENMLVGMRICISIGTPPLPAPISNAVCGPQKPGTKPLLVTTPLGKLNPCPLNACCNVRGQCGTSDAFCKITRSPTGAPGK